MKKSVTIVGDNIQKLLIFSVLLTIAALSVECIAGLIAFSRLAPGSPVYPSLLSAVFPGLFFLLFFILLRQEKLVSRLYLTSLLWVLGSAVSTATTILLSIQLIPYDIYVKYLLGHLNIIGWTVAALALVLSYLISKRLRKNWKSVLYKCITVGMAIAAAVSLLVVISLAVSAAANARSFAGFMSPFITAEFGINCLIVVIFGMSYLLVGGAGRFYRALLVTLSSAFIVVSLGLIISSIATIIRY